MNDDEPKFYIEDAGTKMPRLKNNKICIICGKPSKKRICDLCRM